MKAFAYATAASAASAVQLRGENGRFLAGGIDLLGEMKEYIATPDRLVNVKKLPLTSAVEQDGLGAYRIGANVTISELASHRALGKELPALTQAAAEVGSPQIRNVATLGGNLAQHSRCWYYRQRDLTCLKRGGNTCYAREGQNKYHALFSGNPCISPVVSNLAIALSALNASAILWRDGKETPIPVESLYQDAWNNPLAQNSLRPDDVILRVEIPATKARSAYLQLSEKSDFDWALVSCAASAEVEGIKVSNVRIFLGSVAPIPYTNARACQALEGKMLDVQTTIAAAQAMLQGAKPLTHNGYKVPIATTLIQRTLFKLLT